MTVQELIDALLEIQDKQKIVNFADGRPIMAVHSLKYECVLSDELDESEDE